MEDLKMFDQLVESEPHGADFKNRRRYFVVSTIVVGILFSTAVVVSIFAADYGLGTGNFELVEMIAPEEMAAADPEPERPRPQVRNTSPSTSQLPTRQVNMARIDEPTAVPVGVSTARNTQMQRPDTGRFYIGPMDTNPGNPGTTGRDNSATSGPSGLGETDGTARNTETTEPEESMPPPPARKVESAKRSVSKGVLNGSAISLPKPSYSVTARQVGAQGIVTVQVTIDETGRVISATAVSGHLMLRADAERAARAAKFSPTYLSDVPVKVTGVITYNFTR